MCQPFRPWVKLNSDYLKTKFDKANAIGNIGIENIDHVHPAMQADPQDSGSLLSHAAQDLPII